MGWIFWRCWGSDWTLNTDDCVKDLKSQLDALGIQPIAGSVMPYEYTEHRVFEDPPSEELDSVELEDDTPKSSVGDSVEIEFTDEEPTRRFTYSVNEHKHDPTIGDVSADSELGRSLIGAAEGDDIVLPIGEGQNAIVVGILKDGSESQSEQKSESDQTDMILPIPDDRATLH